ncbi:hypothetical protein G3I32_05825 [Streptomyces coelicoflavus]|uniref:Uncharacterized protein n=1 Tax=Streptomyces coelicoflavus TaxID=285562 RepID=A0A7K3PEV2_9ACTN|nr:hypothetical protein [Streptomyces coelicoflavus]NEB08393.1 hypothetical protein [Streptomyces coelicoflavus]
MTGVDSTGRDTAQERIAALLADTAHEVETGVAPVDAVVRAGRRRRARRRTVTAVAAVVLAGTTGTLALTSMPGGNDSSAPAKPAPADERRVFVPQISTVAYGMSGDVRWAVTAQVWPAPHDKAEAVKQTEAMADWGLTPATSGNPADLVGRTSYFVIRAYGPENATNDELTRRLVDSGSTSRLPWPTGTEVEALPQPLTGKDGPDRLVVGTVPTTAKQVACHWKDGSTTLADRAPDNAPLRKTNAVIRSVRGFPTANWFVCASPSSAAYQSAEVTE